MKITKTTEDDITTYFYDGVKKYGHFKAPNGLESWREYKSGRQIHFKDSDGYETWSEYKDGKEIHYKDSNGYESWSEYKDGKLIHYKDSNGYESWSDDNQENSKNWVKEKDIKPFEFGN